jgi:hypothetical protein
MSLDGGAGCKIDQRIVLIESERSTALLTFSKIQKRSNDGSFGRSTNAVEYNH